MFSPPQSPYTNGVNERHNGILKVWLNRIASDTKGLPLIRVLLEAVRVKNATTRRHGFSATFLAFGYKPEDDLHASIQELIEPSMHPDLTMRQRLEARAAAHRALAEFISSEKLKTALTKHLQNTDKTPLTPGTLVDVYIEPDKMKSSAYWEPGGVVLENPFEESSSKTILVLRANKVPQRVARHKVRPSRAANLVQLTAIDLQKSDWEIAKAFRDAEPIDAPKEGPIPDNENPNVEQTVVDYIEQSTTFVEAMTSLIGFGTGLKNPSKAEKFALQSFTEKWRPRRRRKKILVDDDDEEHESPIRKSVSTSKRFPANAGSSDPGQGPGFQCRHCGDKFDSRNQLHKHLKEEHEEHGERASRPQRSRSPPRAQAQANSPPKAVLPQQDDSQFSPSRSTRLPSVPARPQRSKSIAPTPFRQKAQELIESRERVQPREREASRRRLGSALTASYPSRRSTTSIGLLTRWLTTGTGANRRPECVHPPVYERTERKRLRERQRKFDKVTVDVQLVKMLNSVNRQKSWLRRKLHKSKSSA